MPEPYIPEDEAALYVAGDMRGEQLCEFKARLAESAELRTMVRELEEGVVALALASPVRRAPKEVWAGIEKTVADEANEKFLWSGFPGAWWRNGWAAAAACLVGWLLYALWMNQPSETSKTVIASDARMQPGVTQTDFAPGIAKDVKPSLPSEVEAARDLLQAKMHETVELRSQVNDLAYRVNYLSQMLTKEQALLGETNRLKFVQLSPASGDGAGTNTVALSPELQRAMALAVARELGWTLPTNGLVNNDAGNSTGHAQLTNIAGVDFVDFHASSNGVTAMPRSQPQQQAQAADNTTISPPSSAPQGTIPAFISGNNLIMAIDASIAAKGSQLTFMAGNSDQGQQTIGTTVMGDNPTVVTIPLNTFSDSFSVVPSGLYPSQYPTLSPGIWGITIISSATAVGPGGIFQFFTTGTNAP